MSALLRTLFQSCLLAAVIAAGLAAALWVFAPASAGPRLDAPLVPAPDDARALPVCQISEQRVTGPPVWEMISRLNYVTPQERDALHAEMKRLDPCPIHETGILFAALEPGCEQRVPIYAYDNLVNGVSAPTPDDLLAAEAARTLLTLIEQQAVFDTLPPDLRAACAEARVLTLDPAPHEDPEKTRLISDEESFAAALANVLEDLEPDARRFWVAVGSMPPEEGDHEDGAMAAGAVLTMLDDLGARGALAGLSDRYAALEEDFSGAHILSAGAYLDQQVADMTLGDNPCVTTTVPNIFERLGLSIATLRVDLFLCEG